MLEDSRNANCMRMALNIPLLLLLFSSVAALRALEFPAPYNSEPDKSKPMPAAEAAIKAAQPLSRNGYKVQIAKAAVKRAILQAAGIKTV